MGKVTGEYPKGNRKGRDDAICGGVACGEYPKGNRKARLALCELLPREWGVTDETLEGLAGRAAALGIGDLALIPSLAAARGPSQEPRSRG